MGNICRSPLAEGIMKEKIKKYNLKMEVDSAGTTAYHQGELPDPRSIDIAEKYGIDITDQISRKFQMTDFDKFDKIYVMDKENYSDILSLARNQEDAQKVDMILNEANPGQNLAVPDPYYGGKDGFHHIFKLLDSACENIAQRMITSGYKKASNN